MGWRAALKADPLPWLLEESDPVARYLALRGLLDRPRSADPPIEGAGPARPARTRQSSSAKRPDLAAYRTTSSSPPTAVSASDSGRLWRSGAHHTGRRELVDPRGGVTVVGSPGRDEMYRLIERLG